MIVKRIIAAFCAMVALVSTAEMVPSDMSMAMFMSGRIQEPTVFKVEMAIAPWDYNILPTLTDKFTEDECRNLFWAVRLRPFRSRSDHGLPWSITCCVKKNSEAGNIIKEALKDGGWHAAHVQMRYSSDPKCSKCCVIDEVEMLAAEKPSDIKVRFSNTRIGVVKSKGYDYIQGTITATISSKLKYFKKPVLRVVLMTDENGSRVVRDVLIDEPNVKMMDTSESLRQYTTTDGNRGNEPCMITRYIEELSSSRSEVAKAQYAKVSYVGLPMGSQLGHGVKGWKLRNMFGFAKFDRDENARLVGYRLEMWYDGNCIAVHDTIRPGAIKRLQIPEDWHVSFKYPDKFKYSNPFSCKHVVRD